MQQGIRKQNIIFRMIKVYLGVLTILLAFAYLNAQQPSSELYRINKQTHELLHKLIKTKYFRLFKANLNQQCQLYVRNKICRSKSCTVCRCDSKDIPTNWIKTDKVKKSSQQIGWSEEQDKQQTQNDEMSWSWHVQDNENAEGQYFDLDKNIQSFTNYNGSTIWGMIYEENCFPKQKGKYSQKTQQQDQCKEQKVFYKVISGLHTSISSHLSRFYKNTSLEMQQWADLKEQGDRFFVNKQLYEDRVLSHPQRVQNLFFIYQIYLRAIKQISPYMIENYTIHLQNANNYNETLSILHRLSSKFEKYRFEPFDAQLKTFFYKQNPKVGFYQKYIHNISRLMNCVECEKCRLFGKMQTFGIGTALKILLGYQDLYKRNEIVALYNAWNKISMSVQFYFEMTEGQRVQESLYDWFWVLWFGTIGGAFILLIYLIENIRIEQKIKKMFRHVAFPGQKRERRKDSSSMRQKSE